MKSFPTFVLLTAALIFSGCNKSGELTSMDLPVANVRVQAAERKQLAATEDIVGTVRPKLGATVEAKVSGRIDQMLVVPARW